MIRRRENVLKEEEKTCESYSSSREEIETVEEFAA
jgi:hypothetical protein